MERYALYEAVEEKIRNIENRDVRRILRTLANACKRINGKIDVSAWEDLYVFTCVTDEPMELVFSHYGRGGSLSIMSPAKLYTEFKIPDDWSVLLLGGSSGEKTVGFRVEITEIDGSWSVKVVPILKR